MNKVISLLILSILSISANSQENTTIKIQVDQCNLKDAQSCSELAEDYYLGRSIQKDYQKAFEFSLKACDLGSPEGCFRAANLYENGEGIAPMHDYAFNLYEKGCDLKN